MDDTKNSVWFLHVTETKNKLNETNKIKLFKI